MFDNSKLKDFATNFCSWCCKQTPKERLVSLKPPCEECVNRIECLAHSQCPIEFYCTMCIDSTSKERIVSIMFKGKKYWTGTK